MSTPVKAKFLVVDDEPMVGNLIAAMVAPCGSDVRCAHDGAEAVTIARDFHPDCVVTGIMMPVKDGLQEAVEIMEFLPHCKFVFMSGMANSPEIRDRYELLGFDFRLLLERPFNAVQMHEAITLAGFPCEALR